MVFAALGYDRSRRRAGTRCPTTSGTSSSRGTAPGTRTSRRSSRATRPSRPGTSLRTLERPWRGFERTSRKTRTDPDVLLARRTSEIAQATRLLYSAAQPESDPQLNALQKDSLRVCSPARWRRLCGALRVNLRVRLLDLRDNRLGAYGAEHGELLGNMLKARARVSGADVLIPKMQRPGRTRISCRSLALAPRNARAWHFPRRTRVTGAE